MPLKTLLFVVATLLADQSLFAKDQILGTQRIDNKTYIRAANVWNLPKWMDNNLNFVKSPDVFNGPKAKNEEKLFVDYDQVYCQAKPKHFQGTRGGKTSKFYCLLMDPQGKQVLLDDDGDSEEIKVKYHPPGGENGEVYGEVLGTRLLWALGFGADQMFFVDKVNCFNCGADPFQADEMDRSQPGVPFVFEQVVIEDKFRNSHELKSATMVPTGERNRDGSNNYKKVYEAGVSFKEMMENLPPKARYPEQRKTQLARRDALRLLAVFMHHTDLKAANQRFVCLERRKSDNLCIKPFMMIQDIGTSFGVSLKNGKLDKVNLETWKNTPIWSNPQKCIAQFSNNFVFSRFIDDPIMKAPQISDSGRQFLAALLTGFAADRERVRDLFRAARLDQRPGHNDSIEDWVDAFMDKVEQIKNPVPGKRNFKCPASPYEK